MALSTHKDFGSCRDTVETLAPQLFCEVFHLRDFSRNATKYVGKVLHRFHKGLAGVVLLMPKRFKIGARSAGMAPFFSAVRTRPTQSKSFTYSFCLLKGTNESGVGMYGFHESLVNVLMAEGVVRPLNQHTENGVIIKLISIDGGASLSEFLIDGVLSWTTSAPLVPSETVTVSMAQERLVVGARELAQTSIRALVRRSGASAPRHSRIARHCTRRRSPVEHVNPE